VVQIHYNNINHVTGQTDTSGFDLCTTDQIRPNDADVMAFGTMNITIPPHGTLDTTCSNTIPNVPDFHDIHVFAALPHMHKLGTSISTIDIPSGGGAQEDLGAKPNYSFNTQSWVPVNATIHVGDTVKTRCVWNNPTDQAVTYGENTENEMCYAFTMYYPRVTLAQWSWAAPAYTSTCQ
jgi:hypothetical protein